MKNYLSIFFKGKNNEKKFLSIEEKTKLALEGKSIPICVDENSREERQRKRKLRKMAKIFAKNL